MQNQFVIAFSSIVLYFGMINHTYAQKTIETGADIQDITVYTAAAEMHYTKKLSLPKGKSRIVFTDLTTAIVPNTINISCADPTVSIVTVTDKINYVKHQKDHSQVVREIQDTLKVLADKEGLLHVRLEAYQAEKSLLFKNGTIGGVENGVAVNEIKEASTFFQSRYYTLAENIYLLEKEIKALDLRADRLRRQMNQRTSVTAQATSEIILIVNSPSNKTVEFSFKLLTEKAGWAPLYDFKYVGPNAALDFVFRANVFNATGIPWKDVAIKLSTADPIKGFSIPGLGQANDTQKKDPVSANGQQVTFNQIRVSNVIAEYEIKNKYSIPSDAQPYLIEVDKYAIPSEYSYLVIPKIDPFGFLMAEIPNWNQYNLIPGTTNIYNNGTYMGKTFLETYAYNDTLNLYLGKDQNIQATRTEQNIHHSNKIIGNYAVDKTMIEITVRNNSTSTHKVKILDHVPVVDDNDKVKLNIMELSNAFHDEKDGMIHWNKNLERGETVELKIAYELKAPKEYRDRLSRRKHYFRTISAPSF